MTLAQNFVKTLEICQDYFSCMPCSALKLIRFNMQGSFYPYNFRLGKMIKPSQGLTPCGVFCEVLTEGIGLKPIKFLIEIPLALFLS